MYRAAFLGCGPRARGHAAAYQHVRKGQMVALCDMNAERLQSFGDTYGVAARYDDFAAMVAAEQPDLVHMVTLPALRVPLLTQAVELGVPAVLVEKPLACDMNELAAIEKLGGGRTKIIVNHQLRFHKHYQMLRDDVVAGRIGKLRYIDASCFSRTSEQGSHAMNLVFALNQDSAPVMIHGACSGPDGITNPQFSHPGPDTGWALIEFANGVRAGFLAGEGAPRNEDPSIWMQKRVAAYGEEGHVEWTMIGWSRKLIGGSVERGPLSYGEEDTPAQAALTDAIFDWLDDEAKLHPTRLDISLLEARAIMGIYASAIAKRPLAMPLTSDEPLLPALAASLGG